MKTCATCANWLDATAECAIALKMITNDTDVPSDIERTLNADKKQENNCTYYR